MWYVVQLPKWKGLLLKAVQVKVVKLQHSKEAKTE